MGLDRTKVKTGGMMNFKVDAGSIDFVTTGLTVAVPTTLTYVYCGIGVTKTGCGGANCPVGKVTAGSVTFTRVEATSADTLNYIMLGH